MAGDVTIDKEIRENLCHRRGHESFAFVDITKDKTDIEWEAVISRIAHLEQVAQPANDKDYSERFNEKTPFHRMDSLSQSVFLVRKSSRRPAYRDLLKCSNMKVMHTLIWRRGRRKLS